MITISFCSNLLKSIRQNCNYKNISKFIYSEHVVLGKAGEGTSGWGNVAANGTDRTGINKFYFLIKKPQQNVIKKVKINLFNIFDNFFCIHPLKAELKISHDCIQKSSIFVSLLFNFKIDVRRQKNKKLA